MLTAWRTRPVFALAFLGLLAAGHLLTLTISLRALLEHITLDAPNGVHPALGASLREARLRFEREYIAAVVAQHHGRIPDAAKSLGIQRTNLYRKLRALKLSHAETAS